MPLEEADRVYIKRPEDQSYRRFGYETGPAEGRWQQWIEHYMKPVPGTKVIIMTREIAHHYTIHPVQPRIDVQRD